MNYKSLMLAIFLLGSNISGELPAVAVPTPTASPTVKLSSSELLFNARQKAIDGDYPGAQKLYNQAVKEDPQNYNVYIDRAEFNDDYLKDFPGALADYDQAIKIDPKAIGAWYSRIDLKSNRLNDPQGAVTDLSSLIAIDPKSPQPYVLRGIIRHRKLQQYQVALNDYNEAIVLFEQARKPIKTESQNSFGNLIGSTPLFNKLVTYSFRATLKADKLNDPKGAISDCNQLIATKSMSVYGYTLRSWIKFSKIKDLSGSEADIKQALKLEPGNVVAHNIRAIVLYEGRRNINGAKAHLDYALKVDPKSVLSLYNRGELLYKIERKQEALKDFRQIVKLNQKDKYQAMAAGIIALENKSWSEVIIKFDQVIKEDADMTDAYKYRGIAKLNQGNLVEAQADLQQAAKMYQDFNLQQSYQIIRKVRVES